MNEIIEGTFLKELKNRFLCEVQFSDGSVHECYVPSSCRLSNFLEMEGRIVYLLRNQSKKSRTQFKIIALKTKHGAVPLEMSVSNRIIENQLQKRRFSYLGKRKNVLREQTIQGYKCDLYIPDTKTIIEIKSVLCFEQNTVFPSIYSERANKQLEQILELLDEGYKVVYIFVSLCSKVSKIEINNKIPDFYNPFVSCIQKGMQCHGYNLRMKNLSPMIKGSIDVHW